MVETIATDTDLDDVALVRLPPSPTIEPSTPSNLSTLTSISSSDSTILEIENGTRTKRATRVTRATTSLALPSGIAPITTTTTAYRSPANDRASVAIPTPKSTTG